MFARSCTDPGARQYNFLRLLDRTKHENFMFLHRRLFVTRRQQTAETQMSFPNQIYKLVLSYVLTGLHRAHKSL